MMLMDFVESIGCGAISETDARQSWCRAGRAETIHILVFEVAYQLMIEHMGMFPNEECIHETLRVCSW